MRLETVGGVTIVQGDSLESLREFPDKSIHCCVTSPPYWGLRDYGTAKWEGGDPTCEHKGSGGKGGSGAAGKQTANAMNESSPARGGNPNLCACGATRVDGQVGLESTPDCGRPFMKLRSGLSGKQRQAVLGRLTELGII